MNRLSEDEQTDLFNNLLAGVLCVVFLVVTALVLWPMGKLGLVVRFASGFGLLWLALSVTSLFLLLFRHIFRVDIDSHYNVYVVSALVVSGFWQTCWSAFAVLAIRGFASGSIWSSVVLYLLALVSCLVAFYDIGSFYQGHIYRTVNAPLAIISFIVFSIWPNLGLMLFGWLLNWW
ncbi:MAG: hypothetical protein DMF69_18525 [Acidobacteria bacterium]|nr:MAG: hypothetical protein DMF69_18525 [Acidobacteriota bacterium]